MRIAPLAMALCVAACGDATTDVRPLSSVQSVETSPFDRAYQAGKTHLKADRVGLAIVLFEKALARDPLSVAALNGLGAAYDELHRPDVAKTYYLKALAIEPKGADTLNNMAISAAMAGDTATARGLLVEAADLDPANSTIRNNLQIAALAPKDRPPSPPAADADRPGVERSGLMELTLTIPATSPASRDPLQPIDIGKSMSISAGGTADRPISIEAAVVTAAATPRPVRIDRVSPEELRHLIPSDGPPTLAAVQLGALAGGRVDLAGLLPFVPRDRVTSEALPPPEAERPPNDRLAAAPLAMAGASEMRTSATTMPNRGLPTGRRSCAIEVSNGAGRNRMAARVGGYLTVHGAIVGRLRNAVSFDNAQTILFHRPEGEAEALRVAALLPVTVILQADGELECSVRLQLGRDLLPFDQSLSNEET